MLGSITAWVTGISALAGVVIILLKWWISKSPERRAKKRRKTRVEIHNEIADRDAAAIKRRLDRMRAES